MIFFLDFDGVICDSILECYYSSFLAKNKISPPFDLEDVPTKDFEKFRLWRPFVRSGEDYIVVQHLMSLGCPLPENQRHFDSLLLDYSDQLDVFKQNIYSVRNWFLTKDTSTWASMNPLFPKVEAILKQFSHHPQLHILSTKKSEYIIAILKEKNIFFSNEKIHYAKALDKPKVMKEVMDSSKEKIGVLLDDQVDHLIKIDQPYMHGILALWGYNEKPDFQVSWTLQDFYHYFTHRFPQLPDSIKNSILPE